MRSSGSYGPDELGGFFSLLREAELHPCQMESSPNLPRLAKFSYSCSCSLVLLH